MSQRARQYVLSLGRDQITGRQKQVLMAIAEAHQERYNMSNFSNASLSEDVLMGERQLGRVLTALDEKGLIAYQPGRGAGNFSRCHFPALAPVSESEKATQTRHKPDINPTFSPPLIRKENLNQNQEPDGVDLERDLQPAGGESFTVSSSAFPDRDDEAENSREVQAVLECFEHSPVTVGRASQADWVEATSLLKRYTREQIEHGILLGSARKANTLSQQAGARASPEVGGSVQSLRYFREAIVEAVSDPNCSPAYAQYLRHVLEKFRRGHHSNPKKRPERASA